MRALSIRNPWAAAIIQGTKDVENRTWRPTARLPLTIAVHAGKAFDPFTPPHLDLPTQEACAHLAGTLCGVVDVVSVHHATSCHSACSVWAADGQWHWVLGNARPIAPVPWRGQLGIFSVPDDVIITGRL